MMPHTVVVIPCYNEAARLDSDAFCAAVCKYPDLHFLFVDDGSTDETDRVLHQLVARMPARMDRLRLESNSGKAEAVRQGLQRAFGTGADIVGFLDADLATPIAELCALLAPFRDAQVLMVLASRVAMLGREIERSAWRHYTGRVFATLASLVLDLRVYDTQCGAKLIRNTAETREVFEESFMSPWAFDVEILARLRRLERDHRIPRVARVVVEVPLQRWTDMRGSKIGFTDSIVATTQLVRMWWRYRQ
jgi:glycosyltransferase involved in cell wall biosynthesis